MCFISQIIKRARQNYLLENYISKEKSVTEILQDTGDALQVATWLHKYWLCYIYNLL